MWQTITKPASSLGDLWAVNVNHHISYSSYHDVKTSQCLADNLVVSNKTNMNSLPCVRNSSIFKITGTRRTKLS